MLFPFSRCCHDSRACFISSHGLQVPLEAGRDGLVWNDETLDEFLADPDAFMPGTSMIISSGPVTDPRERAAVINLLKRETMGSAIIESTE